MPVMTRSMTAQIRAAYPTSTLTSLPKFEEMDVEPEPLTIHAPMEEDSVEDISDSDSTDSEDYAVNPPIVRVRTIKEQLEDSKSVEEDSDDEFVEFVAAYPMYWAGYRIPDNEIAIVWMWAEMGRCCTGSIKDAGVGARDMARMFRSHSQVGSINHFKFEFEKHDDMLHFIRMAGSIFRDEFGEIPGVTFVCHAWDSPKPKIDENARTFKFEIARPLFVRSDNIKIEL